MKVLFVTRGFPSEDNIMNGNYEAVQAKALVAKGCQVSVINIRLRRFRYIFSGSHITHKVVDGVDVIRCERASLSTRFWNHPKLSYLVRVKAYKDAFNEYIKENGKPDVVHAHIISIAYRVAFIKEKYHLPFVITEHWTETNVAEVPKWLKEMSSAYSLADQVICVSQILADSLKRNFNINSIVINNMVSDQFFRSTKSVRNDGVVKFIAVGAFRKNKGFDLLVDAFALGHFSQDVKLCIVGDGEERELVENKIQKYGLQNQIKLLGTKSPEEVNELLCNSDCFVLSSRLETFAIVVIEAMAKGLPVIATRSGGPETFLQKEHGILIEKENPQQLAEAMMYMTEHYKEYDSQKIRRFCHDHFSQDVIADRIIEVYNQVLSR